MRLGEICGLMWHDFDEDRGEIMIRRTVHRKDGGGLWTGDTKTSQGRRTIILPPSTVEMLQARQEHSDSKWIFHDPRTYMAETTLNVYSHVTDEMQESAAVRIDRGIAGVKPKTLRRSKGVEEKPFEPYKSPRRRPGTGCISQINEKLWEGRYSPKWIDGKRISRNIYASNEAECEEKLAKLISQMKQELYELRNNAKKKQNKTCSKKS